MSRSSLVAALLCLLILILHTRSARGWWPFSTADTEEETATAEDDQDGSPQVQQVPAKFEVSTAEQKFLAEAQKYLDMSPLEKCQHGVGNWLTRLLNYLILDN